MVLVNYAHGSQLYPGGIMKKWAEILGRLGTVFAVFFLVSYGYDVVRNDYDGDASAHWTWWPLLVTLVLIVLGMLMQASNKNDKDS